MADLLARLAQRTLGVVPVAQPIIASMFAPGPAMAASVPDAESLTPDQTQGLPAPFPARETRQPFSQPSPSSSLLAGRQQPPTAPAQPPYQLTGTQAQHRQSQLDSTEQQHVSTPLANGEPPQVRNSVENNLPSTNISLSLPESSNTPLANGEPPQVRNSVENNLPSTSISLDLPESSNTPLLEKEPIMDTPMARQAITQPGKTAALNDAPISQQQIQPLLIEAKHLPALSLQLSSQTDTVGAPYMAPKLAANADIHEAVGTQ